MHQATENHPRTAKGSACACAAIAALVLALALSIAAPQAFAADSQGRSGIAGAAKALLDEIAPSLSTFEKMQAEQGAGAGVDIADARVQGLQDVMYNGREENPAITLKLDKKTLSEGVDFDVEFIGNTVEPGTVEVTITGKGSYTGIIETRFTIVPGDLSYADISVIPDQEETGDELRPQPTVSLDGYELTEGVDYEVAYSDNVLEGTATLVITGMGNCTGDARATFEIVEGAENEKRDAFSWRDALPFVAGPAIAGIIALGIVGFVLTRRKRNAAKERANS